MAHHMCSISITFLLLAGKLCSADIVQDSDLDDLRSQLSKLSGQIKSAETGEQEARKLLEDSKATALSFESQIGQLKASLADQSSHGSALQQQLALLQSEAEKLRQGEALHRDLVGKLEGVNQELEATKDTLANTLAQLSEKTNSANSAQLSVADAQSALRKAEAQRDEALTQLQSHDSSAADKTRETQNLKQEVQTLQVQIAADKEKEAKLEAELETLRHDVTDLRGKLGMSQQDTLAWQQQVQTAQQAVASAESQLSKALADHTTTQAALIQAESKAEEAIQKMNTLLTSWLPHWLDDRYQQLLLSVEPAKKKVEPYINAAWKQGKAISGQGQKHATTAYVATKTRSLKAYKEARPKLEALWVKIQKLWKEYTKKISKATGPQWQSLKLKAGKKYNASYSAISSWLAKNPQLRRLRRSLEKTIRDLENVSIKYLRRVPALKPYAKKPEVTYLVWALLLAPFFLILTPLLVLRGEQKRDVDLDTRNVAIGRGGVTPQPSSKAVPKNKKARRISVGEEHIRVP